MQTQTQQTIQAWGNGLGIRLTAPIAKAAHLMRGQPITLEIVEGGVMLRPAGEPKISLAQRLQAFDPAVHGGESMTSGLVGAEQF